MGTVSLKWPRESALNKICILKFQHFQAFFLWFIFFNNKLECLPVWAFLILTVGCRFMSFLREAISLLNIRLGWKFLILINTTAYHSKLQATNTHIPSRLKSARKASDKIIVSISYIRKHFCLLLKFLDNKLGCLPVWAFFILIIK
jgi:hypothetical protein